jgi:hypothetical protein
MRLRELAIGGAALAVVAAAAIAPTAMRATSAPSEKGVAAFAGSWQLDPAKSERMGRKRGEGRKRDGASGPRPDSAMGDRGGRMMLPRFLRIVASDQGLAFSDSSGTIVQEIKLGIPVLGGEDKEPPQFMGVLKEDHITVTRTTERGTMTQTYDLDEHGTQLEVTTKMKRAEGGEGRTSKRIYNKVGS